MIQEDYVSFETAKLLKEKGFDERCVCYYNTESLNKFGHPVFDSIEMSLSNSDLEQSDHNYVCYSAPTLQMAMKWLREVHKLHVDVDPSEGDWNPTVITLEDWTCAEKFGDNIPIQDTYEEACEAAIKYCLEKLI